MDNLILLVICPLAFIALLFALPTVKSIRSTAPIVFCVQACISVWLLKAVVTNSSARLIFSPDFSIGQLGACFTILTCIVVACAITHANFFFAQEPDQDITSLRIFYASACLFLVSMLSVFACDNLGFLWISVEATTLSSVPFVYFHKTKHSLEAAWKYLIICSVGIAFALLGTLLIFASSQHSLGGGTLNIAQLITRGDSLQFPLLRLGFLFSVLGYGTKAGIFPLHSWLPDAHSEAPAPASAMLSGALLNCALFSIHRISEIVCSSGHCDLVTRVLVSLGVATVVAGSIFLIRQHSLKRLLAYSSIENVGLILCAIGLRSPILFLLLAANHSAAKVALFLVSGNIIQSCGTKKLSDIRGVLSANPVWAFLLLIGACAVTGAPPFGAFIAEWQLLATGVSMQQWALVLTVVASLTVSFLAVLTHFTKIVCGSPDPAVKTVRSLSSCAVPAALILITLFAGISNVSIFLR